MIIMREHSEENSNGDENITPEPLAQLNEIRKKDSPMYQLKSGIEKWVKLPHPEAYTEILIKIEEAPKNQEKQIGIKGGDPSSILLEEKNISDCVIEALQLIEKEWPQDNEEFNNTQVQKNFWYKLKHHELTPDDVLKFEDELKKLIDNDNQLIDDENANINKNEDKFYVDLYGYIIMQLVSYNSWLKNFKIEQLKFEPEQPIKLKLEMDSDMNEMDDKEKKDNAEENGEGVVYKLQTAKDENNENEKSNQVNENEQNLENEIIKIENSQPGSKKQTVRLDPDNNFIKICKIMSRMIKYTIAAGKPITELHWLLSEGGEFINLMNKIPNFKNAFEHINQIECEDPEFQDLQKQLNVFKQAIEQFKLKPASPLGYGSFEDKEVSENDEESRIRRLSNGRKGVFVVCILASVVCIGSGVNYFGITFWAAAAATKPAAILSIGIPGLIALLCVAILIALSYQLKNKKKGAPIHGTKIPENSEEKKDDKEKEEVDQNNNKKDNNNLQTIEEVDPEQEQENNNSEQQTEPQLEKENENLNDKK